MKKLTTGLLLLLSLTSYANVTLECAKAFGEAVYSSFLLETEIDDDFGMPYDLDSLIGTTVTLTGKANANHPDIIPSEDGSWSYVTLGKRAAQIEANSQFYIETCKDCDFNSATYEYKLSNDGEIYITEMYGSDGSGEFSVYTCEVKK